MNKILLAGLLSVLLSACATMQSNVIPGQMPYTVGTPTGAMLESIPELEGQPKITIAVYSFPDLTGQRKPSSSFSQLSTAVSQGTDVWVIQALKSVSKGNMFQVVERGGLDNLVKERQLIRSTRELYDGDQNVNSLKPMLFAGQTGEILLTQEATKTIASMRAGADVFRFLDMSTKAFEIETGVATNEPTNYAVRSAIEYALYEIIKQGENLGMWKFKYDIHEGM
jgi:curli production assembly/transport component CsgG